MILKGHPVKDVILDKQDADLAGLRWHENGSAVMHSTYDPVTQRTGKVKLHRMIMSRVLNRPLGSDEIVDHIDGNYKNNVRSNLRLTTHVQNRRNNRAYRGSTSKYVGVSWSSGPHKWSAQITCMYKNFAIGLFEDEDEAAWMRDQWTLALFGEYGHLNFDYQPVENSSAESA